MEKVTYLMGAGASAQALPLIKKLRYSTPNRGNLGLPERLFHFAQYFENNNIFQYNYREGQDASEIDTPTKIAEKCIEFGTPDLYAKFLLEKQDYDNYELLCHLVSKYFTFVQQDAKHSFSDSEFDIRALNFLTMISSDSKIPSTIKVISWNYDTQLEIAAKKLSRKKSNEFIQGFSSWPNELNNSKEQFLVHLNGVSGHYYSEKDFVSKNDKKNNLIDFTKRPLISFAWEEDESFEKITFTKTRLEIAKKTVAETIILVVIGYSFPFFNRQMDNEIFKAMKNNQAEYSLKKIYFQDPSNNGDFLKQRFPEIIFHRNGYGRLTKEERVEIIHISDCEQYYIPIEI
jgi:hypothetical protein